MSLIEVFLNLKKKKINLKKIYADVPTTFFSQAKIKTKTYLGGRRDT